MASGEKRDLKGGGSGERWREEPIKVINSWNNTQYMQWLSRAKTADDGRALEGMQWQAIDGIDGEPRREALLIRAGYLIPLNDPIHLDSNDLMFRIALAKENRYHKLEEAAAGYGTRPDRRDQINKRATSRQEKYKVGMWDQLRNGFTELFSFGHDLSEEMQQLRDDAIKEQVQDFVPLEEIVLKIKNFLRAILDDAVLALNRNT